MGVHGGVGNLVCAMVIPELAFCFERQSLIDRFLAFIQNPTIWIDQVYVGIALPLSAACHKFSVLREDRECGRMSHNQIMR